MAEKARQQEIFSREDTPTDRRVFGAFLYHAGLPFRKIEPFTECCYETVRDWVHRCKHLFKRDCRARREVAVDETKIEVDGQQHYYWAAVDCKTLEVFTSTSRPVDLSSTPCCFSKKCSNGAAVARWCGSTAALGTTGRRSC